MNGLGAHRHTPTPGRAHAEARSSAMRKATNTKPVKKPSTITTPYEVAAYLNSPEDMAAYLHAWLNEAPDDAAGIARALGDIAHAKALGVRLRASEAT